MLLTFIPKSIHHIMHCLRDKSLLECSLTKYFIFKFKQKMDQLKKYEGKSLTTVV